MRSGQDRRDNESSSPKGPGRCTKAPFGVHRKTMEWCVAVDDGFEEIEDWPRLLRETPRVNADKVLAEEYLRMREIRNTSSSRFSGSDGDMKLCLEEVLETGTSEGARNEVGFALASETRRMSMTEDEALAALERWNEKNKPPLGRREVEWIVRSAYRRAEPCEFGCNPNGALRRLVDCPGRSNCTYYRKLMQRVRDSQRDVHRMKSGVLR